MLSQVTATRMAPRLQGQSPPTTSKSPDPPACRRHRTSTTLPPSPVSCATGNRHRPAHRPHHTAAAATATSSQRALASMQQVSPYLRRPRWEQGRAARWQRWSQDSPALWPPCPAHHKSSTQVVRHGPRPAPSSLVSVRHPPHLLPLLPLPLPRQGTDSLPPLGLHKASVRRHIEVVATAMVLVLRVTSGRGPDPTSPPAAARLATPQPHGRPGLVRAGRQNPVNADDVDLCGMKAVFASRQMRKEEITITTSPPARLQKYPTLSTWRCLSTQTLPNRSGHTKATALWTQRFV